MNGERFKQVLEKLGISCREFADLANVSPKTVSLWANNHSPVPRLAALYLDLRLSNLKVAECLVKGE